MCSRQTRTIILKSPDSDNIREIIVTPVLFNKSQEGKLPVFNQMDYSSTERMNRKRRIEHLSLEEKILRKKLKNREAAQTSRDRKKARLDYLEQSVKRLREENETLYEEVSSLRSDMESLSRENAELRDERSETEPCSVVGTSTEHVEPKKKEEKNRIPPCTEMCIDDDKTIQTHPVDEETMYTPEEFILTTQVFTNNNDIIIIEDAIEEVVCLTEESDCNFHIKEVNITSDLIKVESADISCSSDDSISDHGYESVDSPLSEPDYVANLFPDLL